MYWLVNLILYFSGLCHRHCRWRHYIFSPSVHCVCSFLGSDLVTSVRDGL